MWSFMFYAVKSKYKTKMSHGVITRTQQRFRHCDSRRNYSFSWNYSLVWTASPLSSTGKSQGGKVEVLLGWGCGERWELCSNPPRSTIQGLWESLKSLGPLVRILKWWKSQIDGAWWWFSNECSYPWNAKENAKTGWSLHFSWIIFVFYNSTIVIQIVNTRASVAWPQCLEARHNKTTWLFQKRRISYFMSSPQIWELLSLFSLHSSPTIAVCVFRVKLCERILFEYCHQS